jgi:phosphate starvation-inducible PhoH-like protein
VQKKRKDRREFTKLEGAADSQRPPNPKELAERAGYQDIATKLFEKYDVLFLIGPAGTGKTFAATRLAWQRLATEQARSVIITRPAVGCGNKTGGYLPGDAKEKMRPWTMPFLDCLRGIVGSAAEKTLDQFESLSLEFCRGRTFDRCVAILDEAQNASIEEIRAYLTRIGYGGKIIVCGDPGQSDIPGGGPHLELIADELEREGAAGVVKFPDSAIVRHPLIAKIEQVFRKIKGVKK